MTAQTVATLKSYFITNAKPTQAQFANVMDSFVSFLDTSAQTIVSDLVLQGGITVSGNATVGDAIIVGSPMGGNKGVGTLNATALYVNGTLVTNASAGGSGTVNVGTANQLAYYPSSTNTVGGTNAIPNGTTATTQSTNDISTKPATTAFANPANSLGSSGYNKFPSGLIIQWGNVSVANAGSTTVTLPIQNTSATYNVTITANGQSAGAQIQSYVDTVSTSAFTIHNMGGGGPILFYWTAIGL